MTKCLTIVQKLMQFYNAGTSGSQNMVYYNLHHQCNESYRETALNTQSHQIFKI